MMISSLFLGVPVEVVVQQWSEEVLKLGANAGVPPEDEQRGPVAGSTPSGQSYQVGLEVPVCLLHRVVL